MKKKFIFLLASIALGNAKVQAQGCIAVRHMACSAGNMGSTGAVMMQEGKFQFTSSYRHLHSYKHFVGTVEQNERVENKTNVINDSHAFDFGLNYTINPRWNVALNIPIVYNDRSSLYEHYGNALTANPEQKRFHTQSQGMGDMRVSANYWLLNPAKLLKGNVALGVGIKAPTGNANVQDNFHKLDKSNRDYTIRKYVDQSIQLGDSGWGYSVEIQGYQSLFKNAFLYYNGFYLFSPKNTNTITGLSVPDQYAGRVGVNYAIAPKQGIIFGLGSRIEGLPAIDLIGKSEGSRRPGYIISIEPSLTYHRKNQIFNISVPYAVVRNRIKSWSDRQDPTGQKHGDAAFADYFVSATYSVRF